MSRQSNANVRVSLSNKGLDYPDCHPLIYPLPCADGGGWVTNDSQRLMAGALDAVTAPVCVLDGSGVIVAVNKAWCDFSANNGGVGDYIGQNYLDQCDASVTQTRNGELHLADGIRAVLRGELPEFTYDYPCHSPTEQRWFSARFAHFRDQDPHVVVAHLNVTDIQEIVVERESQQRKLQRLQRLYSALIEADQLIASSSDLHTLFADICRFSVELGGMAMAWIGTPDLVRERIVPLTSHGTGTAYLDGICVSTRGDLAEGRGPTGTAYRENRTVLNQDFAANSTTQPWRERGKPYGWKSSAAIPVRQAGAVIAVLVVYSTEIDAFDVGEVAVLEKLCANLSHAADTLARVKHEKLLEQQLKQSEETYRTLFETVQQGVVFQDAGGRIVSANPAAERILGTSLAQMQGRTSMDTRWGTIRPDGSPLPGAEHPAMQALTTGQAIKGVVMGVVNPLFSATIWISVSATPILNKGSGAVDYVYAIFDDISETVRLQQELQVQANRDFLTEIANRRYFFHLGARELARAERYASDVSLIMLDIDHFKMVNDTHGHAIGDVVLKAVAQICKKGLREIDILGRIGGEEFAILLPQTSGDTAREVAERIRNTVQDAGVPVGNGAPAIQVTVSMGVSTEKAAQASLDDLLQSADTALYHAKHTGRNRVCCSF